MTFKGGQGLKRRSNFTLVELLAVVGAILVVAALLLMYMNSARNKAAGVSCLSNLKAIGVAFHSYLSDSNGYIFTQDYAKMPDGVNMSWYCHAWGGEGVISDYPKARGKQPGYQLPDHPRNRPLSPYIAGKHVQVCPNDTSSAYNFWTIFFYSLGVKSSDMSGTSYAMNIPSWLSADYKGGFGMSTMNGIRIVRIDDCKFPDKEIAIGDDTIYNSYAEDQRVRDKNVAGKGFHAMDGSNNVMFFSGNASLVKLQWHGLLVDDPVPGDPYRWTNLDKKP